MQTLSVSLRAKGAEGQPLPTVFQQLEVLGARIRRGQLSLVAAAPGGGKSALATNIALKGRYPDGRAIPTLYLSADSDKMTFGSRAVAGVLNLHLSEAEKLLNNPKNFSTEEMRRFEEDTSHLWVNFDSSPTQQDIVDELTAFAYAYGEYPHLIVVDNLMDMAAYDNDERGSHDATLDFCKQVAREYHSAVVVLCHVVGAYEDGKEPIPLSGLMNKIGKRPRLILTLHSYDQNILGVCVVKNSTGRADPSGGLVALIPWVPEKSWMGTVTK